MQMKSMANLTVRSWNQVWLNKVELALNYSVIIAALIIVQFLIILTFRNIKVKIISSMLIPISTTIGFILTFEDQWIERSSLKPLVIQVFFTYVMIIGVTLLLFVYFQHLYD